MAADSALPRDEIVVNPCFRSQQITGTPDAQALTDDLATALLPKIGATPYRVTAYDLEGTVPNRPMAETKKNVGNTATVSGSPREVAMCLSFYGGAGGPSQRGRIYLPMFMLGATTNVRPSSAIMQKVKDLGPIFASLGGLNVDWIIWSRKNRTATRVDHYWVNDEWDTVRSRGLRETVREVVATSG
jgi:hypothetical protein